MDSGNSFYIDGGIGHQGLSPALALMDPLASELSSSFQLDSKNTTRPDLGPYSTKKVLSSKQIPSIERELHIFS